MSQTPAMTIVRTPSDTLAAQPPVTWAIDRLQQALTAREIPVHLGDRLEDGVAGSRTILVAGPTADAAQRILADAGNALPDAPEALALAEGTVDGQSVLLATGADVRGLVYAVLELADRVTYATSSVLATLQVTQPIVERPANPIRSITRLFTSAVEDKAWYDDRAFWQRYLTELATQRYNRFSLALGFGYNFPRDVPDAYFYFAYPFLLDVPGYTVRATNLPDEERDRNLAMLQFIGDEVTRRGLHFQLALWTHAYEWLDSPHTNHAIEGLTADNHAAYCRDAVRLLLQTVPTIDGLTFRVHGESGIPEGSYDFWRQVFAGVRESGRRVEIDLHVKGIDQATIDLALETGLPVVVSPKYWAEHQGLAYQQASIRELEQSRQPGAWEQPFMALSAGSRRFTRYGYADLLTEKRAYGVLYRIWPGTQRLLLWGDPALAAGYGRYANFAGCLGVELCEPLSFKGRMGSGLPGGRAGYADDALTPAGGPPADWEKYRYTYRVWGRLVYNPETDPAGWRRFLHYHFAGAAAAAEAALANASRILLLITTAYHPSASNNRYWPEIYTTMPIVSEDQPHPYGDTPSPKRFGTVSSLDPALFAGVEEFVAEVLTGRSSGKYAPLDVARWLDTFAQAAADHLAEAQAQRGTAAAAAPAAEWRRWAADIAIQVALGRFFANKLRAGVAYALSRRTDSQAALREAVASYRAAREAMAQAADAGRVYRPDLTFGREPWLRGHWSDRLAAIDQDLAAMEAQLGVAPPATGAGQGERSAPSIPSLEAQRVPAIPVQHTPRSGYRSGAPVPIELTMPAREPQATPIAVTLHYRHGNQAERYETAQMTTTGQDFHATIPGEYTVSPYPLAYFFRLSDADGRAWHYPAFNDTLSNQPYFLLRQQEPRP